MKCRSEAGVMSDPVETRADGVEDAVAGAVEGTRIQGRRRAGGRLGFVWNSFHNCAVFGRGHEGPWRGHCHGQITPRSNLSGDRFCGDVSTHGS